MLEKDRSKTNRTALPDDRAFGRRSWHWMAGGIEAKYNPDLTAFYWASEVDDRKDDAARGVVTQGNDAVAIDTSEVGGHVASSDAGDDTLHGIWAVGDSTSNSSSPVPDPSSSVSCPPEKPCLLTLFLIWFGVSVM